jgi:hypothetical protein
LKFFAGEPGLMISTSPASVNCVIAVKSLTGWYGSFSSAAFTVCWW